MSSVAIEPGTSATPVTLKVRRVDLSTDEPLPRHWFGGNVYLTHRANALNLLFPAGEQFFIRSVYRYADRIEDPVLKAQLKAFAGQEAQHGRAHKQGFDMLVEQGFDIASYLEWYERWAFGVLERIAPPILRLSVTVALEHFTSTLATQVLRDDTMARAHPIMAELFRWHAAEEIEHKAVAFDVYKAVGGGYVTRILGLTLAASLLMYFWGVGTRHLLAQEAAVSNAQLKRERATADGLGANRSFLREGLGAYLRPGFHPDHIDNRAFAISYLQRIGRLAS